MFRIRTWVAIAMAAVAIGAVALLSSRSSQSTAKSSSLAPAAQTDTWADVPNGVVVQPPLPDDKATVPAAKALAELNLPKSVTGAETVVALGRFTDTVQGPTVDGVFHPVFGNVLVWRITVPDAPAIVRGLPINQQVKAAHVPPADLTVFVDATTGEPLETVQS
jgi:hypothetical protein